ncbi:cytochrome c oxidase subunit 2A [Sporosarcina sp. CAU 1771]
MEIEKLSNQEKVETENDSSLKGTMFSVGVVGAVIVFMWALLFVIYMYRV